jgi:hypothetical protein
MNLGTSVREVQDQSDYQTQAAKLLAHYNHSKH